MVEVLLALFVGLLLLASRRLVRKEFLIREFDVVLGLIWSLFVLGRIFNPKSLLMIAFVATCFFFITSEKVVTGKEKLYYVLLVVLSTMVIGICHLLNIGVI